MLNSVVLIGRIASEPQLRYTQNSNAVINFNIAVDRPKTEKGSEIETDFIKIVAWKGTAEFVANYLGKGRLIAVDGRLEVSQWTTQEGDKRRDVQVIAHQIKSLEWPKQAAQQPQQPAVSESETSEADYTDPFTDP
jgi:single-strand DNA-binding protein